jgi:hypothetical protein
MGIKTLEDKRNAIKWIIQQIKIYIVAVGAAGASVWGVAEYYLEDYVKETAIEVIEEKNGNKSFREILGDQMDIPSDIVPYYLTDKLNALDSLVSHIEKFEEKYLPLIEKQDAIIPLYRYIEIETGQEYKIMPDGRPHPVMIDEYSIKWIVYSNQRIDLKDL